MKKFVSLVLVVVMVLSLGACGKKDPADMYAEAMQKTAELADMEMQANIDMTMELLGMTMDMKTAMDMKAQGLTAETAVMDMQMTMELMGETMDMQMWYSDGYYYVDAMDTKTKVAMPLDEVMAQIEGGATSEAIPKEAFKEITAEKDGKNTIITYVADGTKMTEQIKESMAMLEEMQLGIDETAMSVEDVKGTVTINADGYIAAQTMETAITMNMGEIAEGVDGGEMKIQMKMDGTYTNPGQPVTVTLPDDLDTYIEVEDMGM